MEIHISSVSRAYLGSNLLVASSRLELIKAGLIIWVTLLLPGAVMALATGSQPPRPRAVLAQPRALSAAAAAPRVPGRASPAAGAGTSGAH